MIYVRIEEFVRFGMRSPACAVPARVGVNAIAEPVRLIAVLFARRRGRRARPRLKAPSLDELVSGVVRIKTFINPDGRTLQNLGREREGSGIVIDDSGLVLTIGYLMVEAHGVEVTSNDGRTVPAEVIGYDHETGFGLLRTLAPLNVRPLVLGKSADLKERDPVLVASFGGRDMVLPVDVVAGASSRATGNTWSTTRSSPRRRIRPGAGRR